MRVACSLLLSLFVLLSVFSCSCSCSCSCSPWSPSPRRLPAVMSALLLPLSLSARPALAFSSKRPPLRWLAWSTRRGAQRHNHGQRREASSVRSRVDEHMSRLHEGIQDLSLKSKSDKSPPSYLSPVWLPRLERMKRPEARSLIPELTAANSLGFVPANGQPPGKSSLSYYVMQQKRLHPDKVLLVRVGEFYEAYGVDALMLIEHCGLNPMAGRARAGCPIRNIQSTLDGLTRAHSALGGERGSGGGPGLTVAVFEESSDFLVAEKLNAPKGRIKTRYLSQIVSPASSTYLHDISSRCQDTIDFKENRPIVGILYTASGYSVSFIRMDEKTVRVHDRLTVEAVRCLLEQTGFTEPLFVSDSLGTSGGGVGAVSPLPGSVASSGSAAQSVVLPFLSRDQAVEVERIKGYNGIQSSKSEPAFHRQVLQRVSSHLGVSVKDFRFTCTDSDDDENRVSDRWNSTSHRRRRVRRPLPVYTSTALQIGLLDNPNVPQLMPKLLAEDYPSYSARYLQRLLLNPPPYHIADHMRSLLRYLMTSAPDGSSSVPVCPAISIGKVVSLLSAGQANAATFREIAANLKAVATLLRSDSAMLPHLMAITAYDSGIASTQLHLLTQLEEAYRVIDNTIALEETILFRKDIPNRDKNTRIPDDFFYRNEYDFRGSISLNSDPSISQLYADMNEHASSLCDAVSSDFPVSGVDVVFDINNNLICFQKVKRKRPPLQAEEDHHTVDFFHPLDRTFTPLPRKFTSASVDAAMKTYLSSCEKLKREVQRKLVQLCTTLISISPEDTPDMSSSYVGSIVQSAHLAVIVNTALYHAYSSQQQGWNLPSMEQVEEMSMSKNDLRLDIKDLTPYWLNRLTAVKNDVDINGIILLTAPNMSGKSTLMRATLVAALLANCGLCIPAATGSYVPRYDCFFIRTSSYDIPSEAKSAFGLEMDDMRVILRDSTPASMVMIDEIGKGTSSRDGAAIAGALLEYLDEQKVSGIFATHLHELMQLPLIAKRLHWRRMGMKYISDASGQFSSPEWTYLLEEGVCTNSMAIVTARAFGLPDSLCSRAEELGDIFDNEGKTLVPAYANLAAPVSSPDPTNVKSLLRGVLADFQSRQHYNASAGSQQCDTKDVGLYEFVYIPHSSATPAYLEGQSCLYVLEIEGAKADSEERIVYVGESESIAKRLKTHKRSFLKYLATSSSIIGERNGSVDLSGARVGTFCVPMKSKSEARFLETQLIGIFKKHGFDIRKDTDQSHRRFGSLFSE